MKSACSTTLQVHFTVGSIWNWSKHTFCNIKTMLLLALQFWIGWSSAKFFMSTYLFLLKNLSIDLKLRKTWQRIIFQDKHYAASKIWFSTCSKPQERNLKEFYGFSIFQMKSVEVGTFFQVHLAPLIGISLFPLAPVDCLMESGSHPLRGASVAKLMGAVVVQ